MSINLRKVSLLGVIYASQGISPGFAQFALPVLLRRQGVSLQVVGFTGLLLLPVAFKFVWGPWSDRLAARGQMGRWMSGLQMALAVCFAGIALVPPKQGVLPFLALVAAGYLIVSVLHVITDGAAVRLLAPAERPLGNAAQFGGYYGGSILAGGLFLVIEPRIGWIPAVAALAVLVASGWAAARALPALPAAEPGASVAPKASVLAFLRGPVFRYVLPLLLLLDMPQNIGISMVNPFLVDAGLTQAQVGLVAGTGGLLAALAGALIGGALLARLPRLVALVGAGLLQGVTLLGFAWLATMTTVPLTAALVVVCAAYGLASLFNVALNSWFMDQCSASQPSTDYSVMSCASVVSYAIAGPIAGGLAAAFGFTWYFAGIGTVAVLLVLAALPWLRSLSARGSLVAAAAPAAPAG